MAFSFNFFSGTEEAIPDLPKEKDESIREESVTLEVAKELFIPENYEPSDYDILEITLKTGETIQYIDSHIIEEKLKNGDLNSKTEEASSLVEALSSGSDLQANIYEGGLKIWECSIDLIKFLSEQNIKFQGLNVLEVGCGAGIPGLYAYSKGATVHFTDYNWEVLKFITIPNVLFNTEADSGDEKCRCRFFSGDWASLTDLLCKDPNFTRYDLIFSSETIYNPQNYEKLLTLFKDMLKPSGTIYLAAKTHYFGVGGSTAFFEADVQRRGIFRWQDVKVLEEGVQRKIIKLDFKKR